MFSEKVFAKAKLQIKVFEKETDRLLVENSGESWGEHSDMDADDYYLPRMFQGVLLDAFGRFLDLEANQLAINRTLPNR